MVGKTPNWRVPQSSSGKNISLVLQKLFKSFFHLHVLLQMNGQRTDVIHEKDREQGISAHYIDKLQHTRSLFKDTSFDMWEISTRGENPQRIKRSIQVSIRH